MSISVFRLVKGGVSSALFAGALVKVGLGWFHADSVRKLRVPELSAPQPEEMSFLTHRQEAEHCHYLCITKYTYSCS